MIATDIAARGIDVEDLSHVINYELPNIPETYVHRIGRTGRAGASGIALSFCDDEEKEYLRDINKLIGKNVPMVPEHPYQMRNTSIEKIPNQTGDNNKRSLETKFRPWFRPMAKWTWTRQRIKGFKTFKFSKILIFAACYK